MRSLPSRPDSIFALQATDHVVKVVPERISGGRCLNGGHFRPPLRELQELCLFDRVGIPPHYQKRAAGFFDCGSSARTIPATEVRNGRLRNPILINLELIDLKGPVNSACGSRSFRIFDF